jgi:hypothetical protein
MHQISYTIYKKEKSNLAKFIVLDWGDKGDSGIGCRIGPPGYTQAGGPVRQTYKGRCQALSPIGPTVYSLIFTLSQIDFSNMAMLGRRYPTELLERGHIEYD